MRVRVCVCVFGSMCVGVCMCVYDVRVYIYKDLLLVKEYFIFY